MHTNGIHVTEWTFRKDYIPLLPVMYSDILYSMLFTSHSQKQCNLLQTPCTKLGVCASSSRLPSGTKSKYIFWWLSSIHLKSLPEWIASTSVPWPRSTHFQCPNQPIPEKNFQLANFYENISDTNFFILDMVTLEAVLLLGNKGDFP